MGMQLPSELTSLLSMLGYDWPESDEEKLFDLGNTWTYLSDQITGAIDQLEDAARTVTDATSARTSTPSGPNGRTASRPCATSPTSESPPTSSASAS